MTSDDQYTDAVETVAEQLYLTDQTRPIGEPLTPWSDYARRYPTAARRYYRAARAVLDALTAGCAEPADVAVLEDGLCRRVWAAALRWWAESAGRSPHPSTVADQIEAGTLTPWADQPDTPGGNTDGPT
jgi:hypothetical protein